MKNFADFVKRKLTTPNNEQMEANGDANVVNGNVKTIEDVKILEPQPQQAAAIEYSEKMELAQISIRDEKILKPQLEDTSEVDLDAELSPVHNFHKQLEAIRAYIRDEGIVALPLRDTAALKVNNLEPQPLEDSKIVKIAQDAENVEERKTLKPLALWPTAPEDTESVGTLELLSPATTVSEDVDTFEDIGVQTSDLQLTAGSAEYIVDDDEETACGDCSHLEIAAGEAGTSQEPNFSNMGPNVDRELLVKHPLQNVWTLWYLENDRTKSWEDMQTEITSFDTVEDFWSVYNHIKPPSEINVGSDYSIFKKGIRPMWEDAANKDGGRWIIPLNKILKEELDKLWLNVLLCLIGEIFDGSDEICGAVVNIRGQTNKISIWTSNGNNKEALLEIGQKMRDALHLGSLKYQLHKDAITKMGSNAISTFTM